MSTASVRPPTTTEAVLDAVRRMLVTGEIAPGSPVRQEALAEQLGVSRVPLREALKVLEGEGSVRYLPRRGYVASELSVDDLVEVYRLRELLEAEAIRVAVPRLTSTDLAALAAAAADVDAAGSAGDLGAMTVANRQFHFLLFDAAAMPRLSRTLRQLWDATDVYRSVYFAGVTNRRRVRHEHRALLAALRSGDAEAAVAAQHAHRANSVTAVTAALGRR
ncbi:MAG: FCD domain-containing protein [Frankiales bacterium]|nr:FCD domain-containing protein [Frankiales bacterium]